MSRPSHWWVLVDGAVDLFRTVGREETRVGQMVPGRWAGGFQAWDDDGVYLATGRGVEFGRLLKVPAPDLRALMEDWLPLAVHLVRGVFGTARSIEATVRQRESLITLGTLSAGLAHELNNPAAAAVRTVESMGETLNALLHSLGELAEGAITADQFLALDRLRRQIEPRPRSVRRCSSPTPRTSWARGWRTTTSTTRGRWPRRWPPRTSPSRGSRSAADLLPGAALTAGLAWVAGTLSVEYAALGAARGDRPGLPARQRGALLHADGPRGPPARRRRRGPREHAW